MNYLSLFVSNTKSKQKVDIKVCTVLMHAKLDLLCKVRLWLFSQRFSERFLVVLVQHWFTDWVKNTLDCCFYCLFYTTTTELCVKSLQSTELIHKPFVLFYLHSFSCQIIPLQCNLLYEELHKTFSSLAIEIQGIHIL